MPFVQKTGMTTNQYTFNGDGQRVKITDSTGTRKLLWDLENILLESNTSDVAQVIYTIEPSGYGNLISQRRVSDGVTDTYLFDALGSMRQLLHSNGAAADTRDYKAFGEINGQSGTTRNPFLWVGELGYYFDEDRDAYYLRARPYGPASARFLTIDPLDFNSDDYNFYRYVLNNPLDYVDPSGRFAVTCRCCNRRSAFRDVFDITANCASILNKAPCCRNACVSEAIQRGYGGRTWTCPTVPRTPWTTPPIGAMLCFRCYTTSFFFCSSLGCEGVEDGFYYMYNVPCVLGCALDCDLFNPLRNPPMA